MGVMPDIELGSLFTAVCVSWSDCHTLSPGKLMSTYFIKNCIIVQFLSAQRRAAKKPLSH